MIMKIYDYFKRVFYQSKYEYSWQVAYRRRNINDNVLIDNTPFQLIPNTEQYWLADPFVYEKDEKVYFFYELFDIGRDKGSIAYSILNNGVISKPKIIVEEPYHLSFPCIFEYDGDLFMIPETGKTHNIYVYKCKEFPDVWVKDKLLLGGIDPSDTIWFEINNMFYIITSLLNNGNPRDTTNYLYEFNMNNGKLQKPFKILNTGKYGVRNAGNIFFKNNMFIRPGQIGEKTYGEGIVFWKCNLVNGKYEEEELGTLHPKDIMLLNENKLSYIGLHTYNVSKHYEIIDLKQRRTNNILKRIQIIFYMIYKRLKLFLINK